VKIDVNDYLRNYGCDALRDDIDARSRPYEPNGVAPDDPPSISFIDPATWHGKPIPERQWLIQDLIPAANVTLLTGHGGAGKTTLALQLASAVALGGYWLDNKLEQGPVMAVCCEDDEPELHRRLACITDRLGGSLIDLRSRFQLATMAGRDALLGVPDRGLIVPTPLFEEISCQAIAMRPKLIVIDNAADVYGGDENSRSMVRQFITLLRGLALDTDAAVLLTLHPSLTGIQTGTGMSGNTAWFNGPRAQLYLKAATTEQGDEPDCGLRELKARKNNYGPLAAKMLLRWRDGVFLVEPGAGVDQLAFKQRAEAVFLALLDQFERQGRNVSPNPGRSYAPTLFATEPEAMGINAAALKTAMARLLSANKIHVRKSGPPSRQRSHLATGPSS
jgi:RecA-family ATPase